MHYGIETVKGARFREVKLPDESRYGLLGKGAVLMLTAYPNRTSPVLRGAWISGASARLAAARLRRPTCRTSSRTSAASRRARCARASSSTARIRLAIPVTASWIRSGSRSRISARSASSALTTRTRARRSTPAACCRTERPSAARRTCAGRLPRIRSKFVQALTESLMTFALGRTLDYRDMPTVREIVRRRREGRLPVRVDRARYRVERRIPQARGRRRYAPGVFAVSPLQ